MSAASEKAARDWRECGSALLMRWWVCRAPAAGRPDRAWVASDPHSGLGKAFCTHAEAIAYATKQAREEAHR